MSKGYFRASGRIQHLPRPVDHLAEVGVADGGSDHQVNRAAEQRFQGFQHPEIAVGVARRFWLLELHQEVKVARLRPEPTSSRGTEQLQTVYAVSATQSVQLGSMKLNIW